MKPEIFDFKGSWTLKNTLYFHYDYHIKVQFAYFTKPINNLTTLVWINRNILGKS